MDFPPVMPGQKSTYTRVRKTGATSDLQYSEGHGSSTINVSGACHEDIVIQSIDRLTLNAAPGASINDASGGNLVTVTIDDSRDVAINGFTINGGAGGADALDCADGSVCRLNGNTIQGAVNGYGVGIFFSQLFLDGGTLQNNFTGLAVINLCEWQGHQCNHPK
jgi:nitrous oxidase accessory protein NosD